MIQRRICETFEQSTGPANLHPLDLVGLAQSEVHAHVVVRDVTRSAAHFIDVESNFALDANSRTNAIPIGFCPDKTDTRSNGWNS